MVASPTPEATPSIEPTPDQAMVLSEAPNPDSPLSRIFDLTLEVPRTVVLECQQADDDQERHRMVSGSGVVHRWVLYGLKADTEYVCSAHTNSVPLGVSNDVLFQTDPLPEDLYEPVLSVPPSDPADVGYTLTNYALMRENTWAYYGDRLVILDAFGHVRWYHEGAGGGDVDATYLGNGVILFGGMASQYYNPTMVDLAQEVLFQAEETTLADYEIPGSFHHDTGLSQLGSTVFAMTKTKFDDGWRAFIVREVDIATNEVVWSWDAYADGVEAGWLEPGNHTNNDPYHANSLQDRWENGRCYIYLGLRDLNQIVKIDYETKGFVWRLGYKGDFILQEADGTLADPERWFFHQHDAKREGDYILVHDNGWGRDQIGGQNYTRALVLELDEEARIARIVFEYTEPDWYEPIWGGLDLLPNGNCLLARSHCPLCGTTDRPGALIELSPAGKVVWRLDYARTDVAFYRADHIGGCDLFNNVLFCPALDVEDDAGAGTPARLSPSLPPRSRDKSGR